MDTDRLCHTGATTVEHDQPMRLRCPCDRAWPCPIGPVVRSAVEPKVNMLEPPGVHKAGRFYTLPGRKAHLG